MTLDDLYQLLRDKQDVAQWHLCDNGELRGTYLGIRVCPLTFAEAVKTGTEPRPHWLPRLAVHGLGIPYPEAANVIFAADRPTDSPTRRALLLACGVKGVDGP